MSGPRQRIAECGMPTHSSARGLCLADVLLSGGSVILGLVVRVACISVLKVEPESDYLGYFTMARNLLAGNGLVDPNGNFAFMNPGYPLLIYGIWSVFGQSLDAIKIFNLVIGCISVALLYLTAVALFKSRIAAVAAAIFWATYLESIIYTEYVAKENMMCFLIVAQSCLVAWFGQSRRKLLLSVLLGGAIGMQALVGNAALSIVPALLLSIYYALDNFRRFACYGIVVVLAALAVVTPWLYRNELTVGAPVLNTNGGFNLYLGNNLDATGLFMSIGDTPLGSEDWNRLRRERGERGAELYVLELAKTYMLENPVSTAALALKKAWLFWIPPFHSSRDSATQGFAETLVRQLWAIQFCVLAALFLVFVAFYTRHQKQFYFIVISVCLYTGVHMIFYVVYRYRLPVMPLLCLAAAYVIDRAWSRFACGSAR